jgi:hypothetical protein
VLSAEIGSMLLLLTINFKSKVKKMISQKKLIVMCLTLCASLEVKSKAVVEFTDSDDFNKRFVKRLKADEKMELDLKKFGWDKCMIKANDTATAIYATCYADRQRSIDFSCWGDESVEISLSGKGLASIKLVCAYK